jgi:UDP-N-acetylglucosamine 2-epimerase (non-hydrolysing)
MKKKTVLAFFGTRPEAIKMAPVVGALKKMSAIDVRVVVSAQHRQMLDQVLDVFGLSADADLDIMRPGQSLFDITREVLGRFETALNDFKPDLVLVHGDTTTSFAGTLASFYKQIPVGHVEAGLRTNDLYRPFPEEANRRMTDALATLHFAPTAEARANLLKENIHRERIFVTGNTVIDALLQAAAARRPIRNSRVAGVLERVRASQGRLILMTAHRRENFGAPFERAFSAIRDLSLRREFADVHWLYPVHPNPNVKEAVARHLRKSPNIHLVEPLDYADLVAAMQASYLVVTDSGGLQEEAPSLGKPVLVLRDVTERPEAVRAGTVRLVGTDKAKIISETRRLLTDPEHYRRMSSAVNPYGDGKASERISQAVLKFFKLRILGPAPFRPRILRGRLTGSRDK